MPGSRGAGMTVQQQNRWTSSAVADEKFHPPDIDHLSLETLKHDFTLARHAPTRKIPYSRSRRHSLRQKCTLTSVPIPARDRRERSADDRERC